MIPELLETVGDRFADRWVAAVFSPAFGFWAGGLLAWLSAHGGADGWRALQALVGGLSGALQAALVVAALLTVVASGALVQRSTLPVLRLLEGYWPKRPPGLVAIRAQLVDRQRQRQEDLSEELQALAGPVTGGHASAGQAERHVELDALLARLPTDPNRILPTRLGNVLRAAESRPYDKYRLESVRCWVPLWLVLPETTRAELAAARGKLDGAVAAWVFGAAFVVWTPLAWWAAVVALAVPFAAYSWWALDAARHYADLVEAAFDLHRGALYRALRLGLPRSPAQDRVVGEFVSSYLLRGSDRADSILLDPET
ncbi:MAG: hypothetical protein ACRD0K_02435 [Egibacteraceae bacterium]